MDTPQSVNEDRNWRNGYVEGFRIGLSTMQEEMNRLRRQLEEAHLKMHRLKADYTHLPGKHLCSR